MRYTMLQPAKTSFRSEHWQRHLSQDMMNEVCLESDKLLLMSCMMQDKANQGGCFSSKAVGTIQHLDNLSPSSMPLYLAGQKPVSKRKTQPHTEINKPRHLMQGTRAKPVPLLVPGRPPLFIFCYHFKTAMSQGTKGKKMP